MKPIQSITFAVNSSKPGAAAVAESLAALAEREGVATHILKDYPLTADALIGQDLCCAIGGDGTLLGVLDAALESGSAVLGINLGKLGFLATFTEAEAARDLPALIQRKILDRRTLGTELHKCKRRLHLWAKRRRHQRNSRQRADPPLRFRQR